MTLTGPRVLVVEDEPAIAETLVYALRTGGFAPTWVSRGEEALVQLRAAAETWALVVLDVGLPDLDGFEVCRRLRRLSEVPLLFLTARSAEIDRVVGLEMGADDYVTKPFSPRELVARVRAILRRQRDLPGATAAPAPRPDRHGFGLDPEKRIVRFHGVALPLTRFEYGLITALLRRPGRVYSRDELMAAVWPDPGASLDRTVDTHIKTLRGKIRQAVPGADPIVTHRGIGYAVEVEA